MISAGFNQSSPAYRAINFQHIQFLNKNLLTFLAEQGFLPSGGIPIGVVEFNNVLKTDDGKLLAYVNDEWKEYPLSDEEQAIKDANLTVAKEASLDQVQLKSWLESIRADKDLLEEL